MIIDVLDHIDHHNVIQWNNKKKLNVKYFKSKQSQFN